MFVPNERLTTKQRLCNPFFLFYLGFFLKSFEKADVRSEETMAPITDTIVTISVSLSCSEIIGATWSTDSFVAINAPGRPVNNFVNKDFIMFFFGFIKIIYKNKQMYKKK